MTLQFLELRKKCRFYINVRSVKAIKKYDNYKKGKYFKKEMHF